MRHENKVIENKVLSYCQALRYMWSSKKKKKKKQQQIVVLRYVQLTNNFKLDFQNVDQRTEGRWLIHGTKHHKDN